MIDFWLPAWKPGPGDADSPVEMNEDVGVMVEDASAEKEHDGELSLPKRKRDDSETVSEIILKRPKIDLRQKGQHNSFFLDHCDDSIKKRPTFANLRRNVHHPNNRFSSSLQPLNSDSSPLRIVCDSGASTASSLQGDDDGNSPQSDISEKSEAKVNSSHEFETSTLPVWNCHSKILDFVGKNQVTMIIGETGSGKTTQIPQMLLADLNNRQQKGSPPVIAITQPRRVAAINLATRVLEEMKARRAKLSSELATTSHRKNDSNQNTTSLEVKTRKQINFRFQFRASRQTQIKFLTDGMLLREAMLNPQLRRYSVIIIDEAHERSLRTDILLGILKTLLQTRPSLRIVVMSATLDYRAFTTFLGHGEVILVPGRQFPVATYNSLTSQEEYMEGLVSTLLQLHLSKDKGDILAFLPGQEEIELARNLVEEKAKQLHKMEGRHSITERTFDYTRNVEIVYGWTLEKKESNHKTESDTDVVHSNEELQQLLERFGSEELKMLRELRSSLGALQNSFGGNPDEEHVEGVIKSADDLESLLLQSVGSLCLPSLFDGNSHSNRRILCGTNLCHQSRDTEYLLDLRVLPIYAALPVEQQQLVFQKSSPDSRRIILATNIAETSVTIPGVRYVVDSGLHKVKTYNPRSGVETLAVQTISRAMANQRSGRAGREGPGESYRLFTEQDYFRMDVQADPEIKRSNLSQVVLELKTLGIKDVLSFPFISKPNTASLEKGLQLLTTIGAIDRSGDMTEFGKKIAALPVDPEFGKFLLDSYEFGCTAEVLTIVSILNSDPIFSNISKRSEGRTSQQQALLSPSNDLSRGVSANPMMELARKKVVSALLLSNSIGFSTIPSCLAGDPHSKEGTQGLDAIRRCLVKSFPTKIAKLESSSSIPTSGNEKDYSTARYVIEPTRTPVHLHPSCGLFGRPNKPTVSVLSRFVV
ncbi:LOW QUALITY PROTEIN: probable pre-mRNA-splicing factor ATP-dependent RNA helicase mog-1 [Condylostylus longicornis]|uniref:LOW QUALITY PROTEIN: probable pre-mRNA-splicing factor ATP-dependent RNA helicase mog-1 n=1 Tax=Condylostylus longicornis TaxID=2530218 RepID=UPI00244E16D8|nr:LOW QUALITY PROTEIN: probable pre-mRNA-splicing factor ATP-dependent RNA helicase mog-1 [Condylostylus longicornis]